MGIVPADSDFHQRPHSKQRPTRIISDGVAVIYNPLVEPAPKGKSAIVFAVPHIGMDGLEDIGLVDHNGLIIPKIPLHRIVDVNLEKLVGVLADVSGYTFVGTHYSRLVFNGACPRNMAISPYTMDGEPIPAYQGVDFPQTKERLLKALYDPYMRALDQQIQRGTHFVGSLDTFTPLTLDGDYGDKRDMAISIIAKDGNAEHVRDLQWAFTEALKPHIEKIQGCVESSFPINLRETVAINKPYGEAMHCRLDALSKGGVVIEVRSDLLDHDELVPVFAKIIYRGVEGVLARPEKVHQKPVTAHEIRNGNGSG